MVGKKWINSLLILAAIAMPSVGMAQQPTKEQLLLPPLPEGWTPRPPGIFGQSAPGVSTASPLAFGPNFGDVFFGVGYQGTTRNDGGDDGSLSGGFGLGNAQTAIGLEVVLVSASTVRSGLFERTMMALKAHKTLPGNAGIAFGIEGIELNGESGADPNWFAVASRVVALRDGGNDATPFSQATLNIGVGNGRFCAAEEVATDVFGTKDCSANVFASVGLRANKYIGLIADYTGQDVNLGVSLAPFPKFPIVFTPALVDVAGMANKEMRFTLGAGIGMRFR
ncbi:MAG: hypothetical protein FJ363_11120 [Gemmatimonadetes bacterium]|nr:hypothetical protein [Gemmatimonadota bacterium]